MRDPRPFVEEGATDFERQLLSAAQSAEPSPEMLRRMERALGFGSVGLASAPGTGTGTATAKSGFRTGLLTAKVAGLVALTVGGVIGARLLLSHPAPHDGRMVPPVAPAVIAGESVGAPVPAVPDTGPSPSPGPTNRSSSVAAGASTSRIAVGSGPEPAPVAANLRGEIALIDGARTALASGSPARALALLHKYRARYPRGTLAPEALALRIQALYQSDRSDQRAHARALARAFVADHPQSPLAERLANLQAGEESR